MNTNLITLPTMTPGLYRGMPSEKYFAAPGISSSLLREMAQSPAHGRDMQLHGKKPTASMKFGSLFHQEFLLPGSWTAPFAIKPKGLSLATKAGKQWKAEQEQAHLEIIKEEEMEAISLMIANAKENCRCQEFFQAGDAEISAFASDPETNLPLKGRIDWLPKGLPCLVDVKTTNSIQAHDFRKTVATMRYHVQAACYLYLYELLGRKRTSFAFVAVETVRPYKVCVYELDDEALEHGRSEFRRLLNLYKRCVDHDDWPGPPDQVLSLPRWAL